MIISKKNDAQASVFESLLDTSRKIITSRSQKDLQLFQERTSAQFEEDVFNSMCQSSKGTIFHNSIELVSGHKFPDIVARKYFGVEVKITKQDHWKSTGNSVLETTRVEDVDKIYLFFGKLSAPPEFKFRKYEECLYEIAVTHSPRYLIDMDLPEGKTIFDKMGTNYDTLRQLENPIRDIVKYYRRNAKRGEETWWMEGGEEIDATIRPTVTLWSNLSDELQERYRNEAMARFPEIFGRSQTKYQNFAAWLAARHGVVDSSLRDRFTAGGQQRIVINGVAYEKIPKIFYYLQENARDVIDIVRTLLVDDVKHYWGIEEYLEQDQVLDRWVSLVISYASQILPDTESFIIHLLGQAFGERKSPPRLKEAMRHYGLNY